MHERKAGFLRILGTGGGKKKMRATVERDLLSKIRDFWGAVDRYGLMCFRAVQMRRRDGFAHPLPGAKEKTEAVILCLDIGGKWRRWCYAVRSPEASSAISVGIPGWIGSLKTTSMVLFISPASALMPALSRISRAAFCRRYSRLIGSSMSR